MGGYEGRVAIVSGASSGMGEATAWRLAREGAHLVLLAAPGDREDLARVAADLGGQSAGTRSTDWAAARQDGASRPPRRLVL
jgi:NAD(P)-dependent dehydrogenase (short-subunit alcohol dehydrogenase family)